MRQGKVSRIASVDFATLALYLFSVSSNLASLADWMSFPPQAIASSSAETKMVLCYELSGI